MLIIPHGCGSFFNKAGMPRSWFLRIAKWGDHREGKGCGRLGLINANNIKTIFLKKHCLFFVQDVFLFLVYIYIFN